LREEHWQPQKRDRTDKKHRETERQKSELGNSLQFLSQLSSGGGEEAEACIISYARQAWQHTGKTICGETPDLTQP
jgi:hypothetical protein